MSQLTLTLPNVGDPSAVADPQVKAALLAIATLVNGGLDGGNLTTAVAAALGLGDGVNVRRGKSIVATTETRTNVAYGLMPTPDRVQGVVVPTDGLIIVGYQATWQESVANAARAALFIGGNQLKVINSNGTVPMTQAAATLPTFSNVNFDTPLLTYGSGLFSMGAGPGGGAAYAGDVTTGQALGAVNLGAGTATKLAAEFNGSVFVLDTVLNYLGGLCMIFAAAGTYDVSVQFKATSGSVTAKNRKLWVSTIGFG